MQVREHHFEAAIASVAEAQRIEPDAMWAGVLLASAHNGQHRYDQAEAVLDAIHGVEAESWQAAYEHARAVIGMKDVAAALRWSDAALAMAPASVTDAHLLRANALTLAHRWAEAASQMKSYLQTSKAAAHRSDVRAALENVKQQTREDDAREIASQ